MINRDFTRENPTLSKFKFLTFINNFCNITFNFYFNFSVENLMRNLVSNLDVFWSIKNVFDICGQKIEKFKGL